MVDATLFCEALTFCDCELGSSDDVFELLGRHLRAGGYVADTWLDAIRERERAYPTGLTCQELGVAIPHADPCHIIKPYIAVVRPKTPVAFEPMAGMGDTVGARLIVNLGLKGHTEASKEDDGAWQVEALQALMEIFMDADKVAEILACDDAAALCACMARLCGRPRV